MHHPATKVNCFMTWGCRSSYHLKRGHVPKSNYRDIESGSTTFCITKLASAFYVYKLIQFHILMSHRTSSWVIRKPPFWISSFRLMECTSHKHHSVFLNWLVFFSPLVSSQLNSRFYDASCPNLTSIVRYNVLSAMANDTRIAASLLRLHFHDCFANVNILFPDIC